MGEEVPVDAPGVRDDDHLSPIGRIDLAVDEAALFESIDHTGDGAGGQAGELREPSRGGRPVEKEKAERSEVCRVKTDVLGRLEARDEQLDNEVPEIQLQVANGFRAGWMFWL